MRFRLCLEGSSKKSKSSKSPSLAKPKVTPELICPRKPPSSTVSKLQPDFRPLTIPMLSKNETSTCPPFLSAKIQSVSFTAGTFGSITTNESPVNHTARLNVNLRRKPGLTLGWLSDGFECVAFRSSDD